MKRYIFFLCMLLAIIAFTSCSDDNSAPLQDPPSITIFYLPYYGNDPYTLIPNGSTISEKLGSRFDIYLKTSYPDLVRVISKLGYIKINPIYEKDLDPECQCIANHIGKDSLLISPLGKNIRDTTYCICINVKEN